MASRVGEIRRILLLDFESGEVRNWKRAAIKTALGIDRGTPLVEKGFRPLINLASSRLDGTFYNFRVFECLTRAIDLARRCKIEISARYLDGVEPISSACTKRVNVTSSDADEWTWNEEKGGISINNRGIRMACSRFSFYQRYPP